MKQKAFILAYCFLYALALHAQPADQLYNTAKNAQYMKPVERDMINEINIVRANPSVYIKVLEPMLLSAKNDLRIRGKGSKNYSLTFRTRTENGKTTNTIDTTWHYTNEEEVKAIQTLVNDLKKLKPLSILLPDSGIYLAGRKHALDNDAHQWTLMHTGSDGSDPWDRITKFSPGMAFGNENIAGRFPEPTAREIVLQLLIDSGIPGYGHRYNLLDPQWTHVACYTSGLKDGMFRWLQEFGRKKN